MKMRSLYLAIVLPIVGISLWFLSLVVAARQGTKVEIAITGFDPRDLLAGHYLEFRLDLKNEALCKESKIIATEDVCVCLSVKEERGIALDSGTVSCVEPSCSLYLRGKCKSGLFVTGNERYYFPETFKDRLAVVPKDASVVLSISSNGQSIVKTLKVDDLEIEKWLQSLSK